MGYWRLKKVLDAIGEVTHHEGIFPYFLLSCGTILKGAFSLDDKLEMLVLHDEVEGKSEPVQWIDAKYIIAVELRKDS